MISDDNVEFSKVVAIVDVLILIARPEMVLCGDLRRVSSLHKLANTALKLTPVHLH